MPAAAIRWRSHQQLPATATVHRRRRLRRQLPATTARELPADAAGSDAGLLPAVQWRIPLWASPAAAEPGPPVVPLVLPAHQPDHWVHDVGVLTGHGRQVDGHSVGAAPSVLARSFSCAVESVPTGGRRVYLIQGLIIVFHFAILFVASASFVYTVLYIIHIT